LDVDQFMEQRPRHVLSTRIYPHRATTGLTVSPQALVAGSLAPMKERGEHDADGWFHL
jgi:hypothetical protein